jgi:uncharacterized protein (TIGR02118 family)
MIKFIALVARKKGMELQAFHDHWRHPHGSMAITLKVIRGYVQSHSIDCALLGPDQARYEGLAELWFDNQTEALGLMEDPLYVQHVGPDELNFVDMEHMKFTFIEEEVLKSRPHERHGSNFGDAFWSVHNRPLSIKLTQFIEADGKQPWAQDNDEKLANSIGAVRQVRARPVAKIHSGNIPRVGPAPFIGVRELWWPTLTAFNRGVAQAPEALKELLGRPAQSFASLYQSERMV